MDLYSSCGLIRQFSSPLCDSLRLINYNVLINLLTLVEVERLVWIDDGARRENLCWYLEWRGHVFSLLFNLSSLEIGYNHILSCPWMKSTWFILSPTQQWPGTLCRFNLVHSSLCDEFHCFLKHDSKLVRLTERPTTGENDSILRLNCRNRQLKLRLALVSHAVGVLVDGHRVISIGKLRLCAQLVLHLSNS